jgi:RNA polymerase sigma-54 factor
MSGPGFSHELRQRQTQSLVLAPQLRQSLKILQVAALDLRSVIQEELQSNPTLEELPMEGVSLDKRDDDHAGENGVEGAGDAHHNSEASAPTDQTIGEPKRDELDFSKDKEFEILGKLDEDWRDHMASVGGAQPYTSEDAERRQHFFDSLVSETSLQEHLMGQAELADLTPPVLEAMRHLVGSLDDRGFLTQTESDLALQSRLPLDAMQEALRVLKTFDPPGLGAKDLPECLLLQLQAKGRGSSLAARVVRDHFVLLTRRRIPDIARRLGVGVEKVQTALEEIRALDQAPGRRFAEDSNRVVVPDASVEKDGDGWKITLNNDYIPRLRISPTYRDLIAKGTLSKQDGEYLRERIRSGKFLINSIAQRQQTIERITREIVKAQADFFEHGVSRLHPLTMTQIAEVVGVHETTVSRAIANKYLQTPHGIFEFKFFFTSGYRAEGGAAVSNTSVKELIADLIACEDRSHPLSDQDLVTKLKEKGLSVARRTVAKYREELGLLSSNLRRDYT